VARSVLSALLVALLLAPTTQPQAVSPNWVTTSNTFSNMLLAVEIKHDPTMGSGQGLSKYDTQVEQPTLEDEDQQRRETELVLAKLKDSVGKQTQRRVEQDLQIMIRRVELDFRLEDYQRTHHVPFLNASRTVFTGLQALLDEQTTAERRPAAVVRMRKYAGLDPGYKPLTEIFKQRVMQQVAKPRVMYPQRAEMETELVRNSNYIEEIPTLMRKYNLTDWQEPWDKLKSQLVEYDEWTKANVLPKARTDFHLPPEEYALALQDFGIDIPADRLAAMAHQAFTDIQAQMRPVAEQIAKQRHLPSSDYRDVIRELKKQQLVGDTILPVYQERLKAIEKIIVDHQIVSLPNRPVRIRLASTAESAQVPSPHVVPPPFLNNSGEKGEFVLPLNIPPGPGQSAQDKYDDFTFDAAAWSLTAHEARPGHEMQFTSILEHGVSLARYFYAFNATNVEGWGLYSEYLIEPYEPPEGMLISLDFRLLRAARAFLDFEIQSGKIQPQDALRILEQDVVRSKPFAQEEVNRYTYGARGQSGCYFYGYTNLLALRKDAQAVLGAKFNQKKFHDFILSQGLLPADLMRNAVIEDFVQPNH